MTIQKINTYFGATIKGDIQTLTRTSIRRGLSKNQIKSSFDIINNVCPKKEDKVYLYYRNMYDIFGEFAGTRSGVKVFKDGVLYEKNIDPNKLYPKYLLNKFAITVRDLVSGKIQPDETVKLYN